MNNKIIKSSWVLFWVFALAMIPSFSLSAQQEVSAPAALLPIPNANQLRWQRQEMEMFIHFTVNQYTGKEWGHGDEDPAIFNPVNLDTDQWAKVATECGFSRMVLTAKHHDGFCLWPSETTDHSVEQSPWKQGQGDVVQEFTDSCEKFNIEKGFYLSPWDRNHPTYGSGDEYNKVYLQQLNELLTQYGEVTEQWFDGACGEGPNGKKQVYDLDLFWDTVNQLQPKAVIFSDRGPDARWIGNERGVAGETCWSPINRDSYKVGDTASWVPGYLNEGDENGIDWVVGESDVSIRPGWFWHKSEKPHSLKKLLDIYFKSIGRNSVLMLNIPPNPQGRFDQADVDRLYELRAALDSIFKINFAQTAIASADIERGKSELYAASQVLDGDLDSYWAMEDTDRNGVIELDLGQKHKISVVMIQEPIQLGQRIKKHHVEARVNGKWKTVFKGTTIGYKRLHRAKRAFKCDKIRIVIEDSKATPLISEVGLFLEN